MYRFLLAFFAVIIINILFLIFFIRINGSSFLDQLTDDNMKVLMRVIENSIVDDLCRIDYNRIENIFNQTLLEDAGIESCRIFDGNGILLAQGGIDHLSPYTYEPDPLGLKIVETDGLYIERHHHYKIIGWRYMAGGKIIGGAAAHFSKDMILSQMNRIVLSLIISSLIIIGFGGVLFFLLIERISMPLRQLAEIMESYGEEGFEIDFSYDRDDEISILSDSLKSMSLQIRDSFERLKLSEERFELAVQGSKDGIWEYRSYEKKIYSSPRCNEILGLDANYELDGLQSWLNMIVEEDKDSMNAAIRSIREKNIEYLDEICRHRKADGEIVWLRVRGKGIYNNNGLCIRIAGSLSDITEKKTAEDRLVHIALYDTLTSLPTRLLLLERLKVVERRYKRKRMGDFAVLFLDYDGFKKVNDTYGHSVGDLLLKAISARLKSCVRSEDLISRIGGDEFVILLEDCGSRNQVIEVAERILRYSSKEFNLKKNSIFLSVSIGILMGKNMTDDMAENPDRMIQAADIAMYSAKKSGKGRYHFYRDEMQKQISSKWRIQNDLHKALDKKELFLVYQPVISLKDGSLSGTEALIRWHHPERGYISPADFIPSAEENSFITQITDWVLGELKSIYRSSFAEVRERQGIRLAFNVSTRDFSNNSAILLRLLDLFSDCEEALKILDVEVTETSLIDNFESVSVQLGELQKKGMKVKLDDFGTGYSSLSYLHSFPLDSLKIDRSFVNTLPTDKDNLNIIKRLIELAHDLGLEVIAEGIETIEQHRILRELGCDMGQGYLYSKGLKLQDFLYFQENIGTLQDKLFRQKV